MIMGPVGVGKTFMASALGHVAVRRRYTVTFCRADVLLKRLRASRLDNSHDAEMRKLMRVDLLILDDFALQPFDALDTADIYELVVERHRSASTLVTSNRVPVEWIAQMTDALLAQSAIDRLQSAAYELTPRRRLLPAPPEARPRRRWDDTPSTPPTSTLLTDALSTVIIDRPTLESPERRSLHTDGGVVPSAWRATSRGPSASSWQGRFQNVKKPLFPIKPIGGSPSPG